MAFRRSEIEKYEDRIKQASSLRTAQVDCERRDCPGPGTDPLAGLAARLEVAGARRLCEKRDAFDVVALDSPGPQTRSTFPLGKCRGHLSIPMRVHGCELLVARVATRIV